MKPVAFDIRRAFGALLFCICFAVASASVVAADSLPKDIAARIATKWLADAKQIRTPEGVIYGRGTNLKLGKAVL